MVTRTDLECVADLRKTRTEYPKLVLGARIP